MITKISNKTPHYKDERGIFDVVRSCKCGYAVLKDRITEQWDICPLCGEPLTSKRVDYSPAAGN